MKPDHAGDMIRSALKLPEGFSVSVETRPTELSIALVDGEGLGCRYYRENFSYGSVFRYETSRWLNAVLGRMQKAALAMCEFPERFSS